MCSPRVSVLMPVYNGERYVQSAVRSVLNQTFSDFELIAVDDGSTDRSRKLLDTLGAHDARIRVISRPNTGIVGALNDALAGARGEYIARMDCDDLAAPERFAAQVRFLDDRRDVVLVGSRVLLIDKDGAPVGDMAGVARGSAAIERALLDGGWPVVHPTILTRKNAMVAVGGYREGTFPYEDHDLFLRLLDHGRMENLAEPLLHYRRHAQSVVVSQKNTRLILLDVVDAARRRRGEPPIDRAADRPNNPRWSRRHDWVWLALRSGHTRTARKYSFRAVREQPFLKESWEALYCAWRGR
ncbi:MAG TPA: glycosyltransferase [Tepidisphaeraceae bacterium]|jgi:glycosyltransferase involved in cell wall biosynthesis|nr:glycosyltransferase [Tepidisphaeraceae bacterium]